MSARLTDHGRAVLETLERARAPLSAAAITSALPYLRRPSVVIQHLRDLGYVTPSHHVTITLYALTDAGRAAVVEGR